MKETINELQDGDKFYHKGEYFQKKQSNPPKELQQDTTVLPVMERNTHTTVYSLKIGDRFYKTKDRYKTVYEKVDHEVKQTRWQTYKHWCILASVADSTSMNEAWKQSHEIPVKSNTEVIFLRHKNN